METKYTFTPRNLQPHDHSIRKFGSFFDPLFQFLQGS